LHYPKLNKALSEDGWDEWTYQSGDARKRIYGGLLCENLVQALARIVVMYQMLELSRDMRIVMTTHDEIVACVPRHQADSAFGRMMAVMTTPPEWWADIPLAAEGGYADNYSK
jgi:DNA polymerase